MKYSYYRLDEVVGVVSGSTPSTAKKEYYGGSILWATPKDLSSLDDIYIENTEKKITEEGYKSCSTSMLPTGAVLFSSRAPIGLIAIAKHDICTNQGFKNFVCDKRKIHPEYLYYCLRYFRPMIQKLGRGATFAEISKELISSFKIPVPPIEKQKEIARLLVKAEQLLKKRRKTLELSDQFLKSAFLEMFGDPMKNQKIWKLSRLVDACDKITDGEHITPQRIDNGILLLSARNIQNGYIDIVNESVDHIPESEFERIKRRCNPEFGDILLSCSGSIGRVTRVKITEQFSLVRSVALIKPSKELLKSEYLEAYLQTDYVQSVIDRSANKSSQANIFLGPIKELPVLLPPIDLQQKFADLVQRVERLKEKQKQSEAQLQNLFNSLMQRAFRGEMFKE